VFIPAVKRVVCGPGLPEYPKEAIQVAHHITPPGHHDPRRVLQVYGSWKRHSVSNPVDVRGAIRRALTIKGGPPHPCSLYVPPSSGKRTKREQTRTKGEHLCVCLLCHVHPLFQVGGFKCSPFVRLRCNTQGRGPVLFNVVCIELYASAPDCKHPLGC
jgi:hypothetical protein